MQCSYQAEEFRPGVLVHPEVGYHYSRIIMIPRQFERFNEETTKRKVARMMKRDLGTKDQSIKKHVERMMKRGNKFGFSPF